MSGSSQGSSIQILAPDSSSRKTDRFYKTKRAISLLFSSTPRITHMQTSVDPAVLTSSPLRQLYEVLSVFEANRDWSQSARAALLEKVAARLPAPHQPDVFMFHSMLEDLGMEGLPELDLSETETVPGISLLSRSATRPQISTPQSDQSVDRTKSDNTKLSPQLASAMTTREMAAFVMLQRFGELSEQRIESWKRVARLIVTQPMSGFVDTVKPKETTW